MCDFASFVITKDGRILFGNPFSHSGIEAGWGLKPGEYREAEWVGERPNSLNVRLEPGERDAAWWVSAVTGKYRTRTALLESVVESRTNGVVYQWEHGSIVAVNAPQATYLRLYNLPLVKTVNAPQATYLELDNLPLVKTVNAPQATYLRLYNLPLGVAERLRARRDEVPA